MRPYDILAQNATENPHNIAITCQNVSVTYDALMKQIDQLSQRLPVPHSDRQTIAILLPPTIEFIVAIFACQKRGYAYIPLDIAHPSAFGAHILHDAAADYLLTESKFNSLAQAIISPKTHIIQIDAEQIRPTPCDISDIKNELAYIIYTSGSTGAPKGVPVKIDSVLNLIDSTHQLYQIGVSDTVPLFHSIGFDVSVWEIYSTLLNGAHLIIVPEAIKKSPQDYWQFIVKNGVTLINMTPSYCYLLMNVMQHSRESHGSSPLRLILLAGEPFFAKKIRFWFELPIAQRVAIYNMYGITEGTIHSTHLKIEPAMAEQDDSPIGTPLRGINIALVDEHNAPVTMTTGELCLSGISVTSGYLGNEQLNQEKFLWKNLDNTTENFWFKTGDLVQQQEQGLFYLGRKDNVIKIRGYRVSLLEIERALSHYPGIENAAVVKCHMAHDQLRVIAFVQSHHMLNEKDILHDLKQRLPDYMCPSRIIVLEQFPLTRHGKVDTKTLRTKFEHNTVTFAPLDDEISPLHHIKYAWMQTLNREQMDIHANFFDVGGDSLLLAKLQFFLQSSLNIDIKLLDLLKYPTIAKFSDFLTQSCVKEY